MNILDMASQLINIYKDIIKRRGKVERGYGICYGPRV